MAVWVEQLTILEVEVGGVVPFKRLSMSAIYVEAQKSLGTFHTKEVLSLLVL